MDMMNSFN